MEFIVVVAALAVLVAMFLPGLMKTRVRASRLNCVNHLKQVGLSFRMWAQDNGDQFPMRVSVTNGGTMELVESGTVYPHFLVMSNELNTPKILVCPEDRRRSPAMSFSTNFSNTNLSYFVGVDASELMPQSFLTGDDHFTVHGQRPKSGLLQLGTNRPVAWLRERHAYGGNVGLADGSVQSFTSASFLRSVAGSGVGTNRLAIP